MVMLFKLRRLEVKNYDSCVKVKRNMEFLTKRILKNSRIRLVFPQLFLHEYLNDLSARIKRLSLLVLKVWIAL